MTARRVRATTAVRGGIARDAPAVLFGGARRRRPPARLLAVLTLLTLAATLLAVAPAVAVPAPPDAGPAPPPPPAAPAPAGTGQDRPPPPRPTIAWRTSRAVGLPWNGRLVRGVQLPAEGPDWFTWHPVLERQPDRP